MKLTNRLTAISVANREQTQLEALNLVRRADEVPDLICGSVESYWTCRSGRFVGDAGVLSRDGILDAASSTTDVQGSVAVGIGEGRLIAVVSPDIATAPAIWINIEVCAVGGEGVGGDGMPRNEVGRIESRYGQTWELTLGNVSRYDPAARSPDGSNTEPAGGCCSVVTSDTREYELTPAGDPPGIEAWLALRRDCYLKAGFITAADLVDGVYRDRYDAYAHHYLGRLKGDGPGGCVRLIVRGPDRPLQVELHAPVAVTPISAEVSGLAVLPVHVGGPLVFGLIRAAVEEAGRLGIDDLYFEIEEWLLSSLQRRGLPARALSDPLWVYHSWNVIGHMRVGAFREAALDCARGDAESPIGRYFARSWDWSVSGGDMRAAQPRSRPRPA